MKIDSSAKSLGGPGNSPKPGTSRTPVTPTEAGGGNQTATVALSPLSARLQEIESNLTTSPAIDSERVEAIRAAISAGTFRIDASKIADGLVDSVRQMLAAQK